MTSLYSNVAFLFLIFGSSFLPLLIFYWVDKKRLSDKNNVSFYKIKIWNSSISLTRNALYQFIWWLCILILFDWVLPLPISLPALLVSFFIAFSLVRTNSSLRNSNSIPTSNTQDVLSSLKDMQARLSNIQSHIEELAVEIENRKIEVDEKQKITQSLDEDINKKLKESEEWKKLNESQKQLVINAAAEALNKKTLSQNVKIVLGTIFLNLAATLVWALFGNPERKELIDSVAAFFNSLK